MALSAVSLEQSCGSCTCSPHLPLSPQATYVLLALAWVFVPIYISSEVSLLMRPPTGGLGLGPSGW